MICGQNVSLNDLGILQIFQTTSLLQKSLANAIVSPTVSLLKYYDGIISIQTLMANTTNLSLLFLNNSNMIGTAILNLFAKSLNLNSQNATWNAVNFLYLMNDSTTTL